MFFDWLNSSIGRKQIVAVTGLILILFVLGHLAGNLLIFLGPEAFNGYAEKLAHLRPGLYFVEIVLAWIFIIHMWVTALLVLGNIRSRPKEYKVIKPQGDRSWATQLMPYTGTIILLFIIWHLKDFTFADKNGGLSFLPDGQSYGLYGIVVNTFRNPTHSGLYIIVMFCLGLHLSHGVQSFLQTFGFNHPRLTPAIVQFSNFFALLIAVAYSSIPLYVMIKFV